MRIHTVTARVNAAGDISTARWKISARREQQTTIRQALYPADARFSGAPVHRLGPTAVPGGAPLAFAPRTREDGFDVCTPRGRRGVGVRRADARALPRALDARRARRGHDAALFRSRSSARADGARLRLRARRRRRREPLPRPRTRDRAPPRPRSGRHPRGVEEEAHAGGARGGARSPRGARASRGGGGGARRVRGGGGGAPRGRRGRRRPRPRRSRLRRGRPGVGRRGGVRGGAARGGRGGG